MKRRVVAFAHLYTNPFRLWRDWLLWAMACQVFQLPAFWVGVIVMLQVLQLLLVVGAWAQEEESEPQWKEKTP